MFMSDARTLGNESGPGFGACGKPWHRGWQVCGKATAQGAMLVVYSRDSGCRRAVSQIYPLKSGRGTNLYTVSVVPLLQSCKRARDQKGLEQEAQQQPAGHALKCLGTDHAPDSIRSGAVPCFTRSHARQAFDASRIKQTHFPMGCVDQPVAPELGKNPAYGFFAQSQ